VDGAFIEKAQSTLEAAQQVSHLVMSAKDVIQGTPTSKVEMSVEVKEKVLDVAEKASEGLTWAAVFAYANVDTALFMFVVSGVYFGLKRRFAQVEKESADDKKPSLFSLVAAGLKIGGIIAGLAEFGRAFDPRKSQGVGIVCELVKSLGVFFEGKTEEKKSSHPGLGASFCPPSHVKEHTEKCAAYGRENGHECICDGPMVEVENVVVSRTEAEKLALIDDDDEFAFMARLYRLGDGVKNLLRENVWKIGWFLVAVSLGVGLYVFMHASRLLDSRLDDGDDEGSGNRGKNKKSRRTGGKAAQRKRLAYYNMGDVDSILDFWVDDQHAETPDKGTSLKPGHVYSWIVLGADGRRYTKEVEILENYKECCHTTSCPMKTQTSINEVCNVKCGGHNCTHWVGCKPTTEKSPKVGTTPAKALPPVPPKKETVATLPVVPAGKNHAKNVKKAAKRKEKREALVKGSDLTDHVAQRACLGEALRKDGSFLQQVFVSWAGVLVNAHSIEEATHFKFGDKTWPKTKVVTAKVSGNTDLVLCARADGMPKAWPKKRFEKPEVSQKVYFLAQKGKSSQGTVQVVDENGGDGLTMRTTCSTAPGDCGGVYLNTNGNVVGVHFGAGQPNVNNRAVPVTDSMLALQPKN